MPKSALVWFKDALKQKYAINFNMPVILRKNNNKCFFVDMLTGLFCHLENNFIFAYNKYLGTFLIKKLQLWRTTIMTKKWKAFIANA